MELKVITPPPIPRNLCIRESIQWNWKQLPNIVCYELLSLPESIQWNWKRDTLGSNASASHGGIHSMELKGSKPRVTPGKRGLPGIHSMELKALGLLWSARLLGWTNPFNGIERALPHPCCELCERESIQWNWKSRILPASSANTVTMNPFNGIERC